MSGIQRIGNVFYRVSDMDVAVQFYGQVLGLALKFRDGNHWATFDVGGTTLALAGSGPPPSKEGGATVSLRVEELSQYAADLRRRGAVVSHVVSHPHEWRATVQDPDGNQLMLYEPLSRR